MDVEKHSVYKAKASLLYLVLQAFTVRIERRTKLTKPEVQEIEAANDTSTTKQTPRLPKATGSRA